MEGENFVAGVFVMLVFFAVCIATAGISSGIEESRIAESCKLSGAVVLDGKAYTCEVIE